MSLWPILWAINSAPVADAEERLILVALADRASSDGTDAYPSKKSIAQVALIDAKTVQRRLRTLMERGLIAEGNQDAARRIPEHFRPTVYDLLIPYSWWSPADMERVNSERVGRGLRPLTPQDRPDLAEAPPRKARADKGRRRKKAAADGGTTSPRGEDSESPGQTGQEGGTTSPPNLPY
ncbi:helix-turn-helix domain-containing protein [Streptomyces cylindrosporus]|uniref:Helix-turn-helix domain-containing protein n=1 Tax=Streptomyces cylindrosporus TaxID=2927583 RepID=A0ABS9YPC8_9ACTN|nr:helix-turn-helix domain-containing protein [Streptomyces cylindrosporus]MCI3279125.1 helix-turn-helix domain-containing protein [Streptomyces cylindrosporus]